jgi:hypothetical protein
VADFRDPRAPMALSYPTVPLLWLGHEKMRGRTRERERGCREKERERGY